MRLPDKYGLRHTIDRIYTYCRPYVKHERQTHWKRSVNTWQGSAVTVFVQETIVGLCTQFAENVISYRWSRSTTYEHRHRRDRQRVWTQDSTSSRKEHVQYAFAWRTAAPYLSVRRFVCLCINMHICNPCGTNFSCSCSFPAVRSVQTFVEEKPLDQSGWSRRDMFMYLCELPVYNQHSDPVLDWYTICVVGRSRLLSGKRERRNPTMRAND